MNGIDKLNSKQREAALHKDGPLLILAGAGSGKTSTIVHRIVHLIESEGVEPGSILAVTFTNKAAGEMNERVKQLLSRPEHFDFYQDSNGKDMIRGLWISTFHRFCLRVLKQDATLLGFSSNFAICDTSEQKGVIKECVKSLQLDEKKYSPAYILGIISKVKTEGLSPDDYAKRVSDSVSRAPLAEIYKLYMQILKKSDRMDFDDLIVNTVRLFEGFPEVLERYQKRFRYILVDEYQDTDRMQNLIVKYIAGKQRNVCVVGDDDQCIYTWRGAEIENILRFEHDFKGAKVIKLEQNYRSCGNILNAANSVIAHNKMRKSKKLWTEHDDGEKVHFVSCYDEKEEARAVAREIVKGTEDGRSYSDFAVLYRSNAQSRTFEEAFSAFGIPYQVVGGLRYYDRKEIRDMLAYLRLVSNPNDNLSLQRIINEPKRGIGGVTLAKIIAYAAAYDISLFESIRSNEVLSSVSQKSKMALEELVVAIEYFSEGGNYATLSEIYDGLLEKTGYLPALREQENIESKGRIENLLEFKSVIYDYVQTDPQITVSAFLDDISLISDIDNHDRDADSVSLMTLHGAKGLEFPVVFLPGMEDGVFPSSQAIDRVDGVEEERRLFYVGMTRARESLHLLRAKARTIYGRYGATTESRFLREISLEFLDGAEKLSSDRTGYFHRAMGADDGFEDYYKGTPIVRPFDLLQHIQDNKTGSMTERPQSQKIDLSDGDKVSHPKFGEGLVLETGPRTVTVMFGSVGKKKLALDVAPLEKI